RSLGKRLLYRVSRSRAARNGYPVLVDDDSRRLTKRLAAGLRLHRENAAATDDDVIDVESVTLYVVKDVPPVRSELLQMIGNYPLPVASQFQQTRLIDEISDPKARDGGNDQCEDRVQPRIRLSLGEVANPLCNGKQECSPHRDQPRNKLVVQQIVEPLIQRLTGLAQRRFDQRRFLS